VPLSPVHLLFGERVNAHLPGARCVGCFFVSRASLAVFLLPRILIVKVLEVLRETARKLVKLPYFTGARAMFPFQRAFQLVGPRWTPARKHTTDGQGLYQSSASSKVPQKTLGTFLDRNADLHVEVHHCLLMVLVERSRREVNAAPVFVLDCVEKARSKGNGSTPRCTKCLVSGRQLEIYLYATKLTTDKTFYAATLETFKLFTAAHYHRVLKVALTLGGDLNAHQVTRAYLMESFKLSENGKNLVDERRFFLGAKS